jgi:hypothetical protein
MSAAVSNAAHADGGLHVPNVRNELLLLSATTVTRWLSALDHVSAATGRILAGGWTRALSGHVTPARRSAPAPRLCPTIASSGASVLRSSACHPRSDLEVAALRGPLRDAGRAPLSSGSWSDGWYQRDFARHSQALARVRRIQRESLGKLNVSCLLQTQLLGNGLLLHESGREAVTSDFPGLSCSAATVGDLLEMQWVGPQVLRFRLNPFANASLH